MGSNFLTDPRVTNATDGTSQAMNPQAFASPQGVTNGLEILKRLYGVNAPVEYGAPTAGPFSWPGQAQAAPMSHALDGSPLGGVDLGALNALYANHPQNVADNIAKESIASDRRIDTTGQNFAPSATAAPQAGASATGLPPSFASDLLGSPVVPSVGRQQPNPQVPQQSAFAPASGQNTGMGIAQLQKVVQLLRSKGIQI